MDPSNLVTTVLTLALLGLVVVFGQRFAAHLATKAGI